MDDPQLRVTPGPDGWVAWSAEYEAAKSEQAARQTERVCAAASPTLSVTGHTGPWAELMGRYLLDESRLANGSPVWTHDGDAHGAKHFIYRTSGDSGQWAIALEEQQIEQGLGSILSESAAALPTDRDAAGAELKWEYMEPLSGEFVDDGSIAVTEGEEAARAWAVAEAPRRAAEKKEAAKRAMAACAKAPPRVVVEGHTGPWTQLMGAYRATALRANGYPIYKLGHHRARGSREDSYYLYRILNGQVLRTLCLGRRSMAHLLRPSSTTLNPTPSTPSSEYPNAPICPNGTPPPTPRPTNSSPPSLHHTAVGYNNQMGAHCGQPGAGREHRSCGTAHRKPQLAVFQRGGTRWFVRWGRSRRSVAHSASGREGGGQCRGRTQRQWQRRRRRHSHQRRE